MMSQRPRQVSPFSDMQLAASGQRRAASGAQPATQRAVQRFSQASTVSYH